jgi:hypothetical protein
MLGSAGSSLACNCLFSNLPSLVYSGVVAHLHRARVKRTRLRGSATLWVRKTLNPRVALPHAQESYEIMDVPNSGHLRCSL